MQLNRIARRVQENYGARFTWQPEVLGAITARCTESASGARNVESILSRTLLPELSARVLARMADGASFSEVTVVTSPDGGFDCIVA
jgi:type VI secretion system protein VasG